MLLGFSRIGGQGDETHSEEAQDTGTQRGRRALGIVSWGTVCLSHTGKDSDVPAAERKLETTEVSAP